MSGINRGVNPRDVLYPETNWRLMDILYEGRWWSLALGRWKQDGEWRPVLAQRWNGDKGELGNPISIGFPTWFIVPDSTYKLFVDSEFVPAEKRQFLVNVLGLDIDP